MIASRHWGIRRMTTGIKLQIRAMVFAALAVSIAPANAHSQTAQVKRIDVIEYGIYTDEIIKTQHEQTGLTRNTVGNIRHAATTRTVPAQHGVTFGFRYRIVGAPNGAPITVTKITIFPPPGLHKPGVAKPFQRDQYLLSRKIGETSYTAYSFDDSWELVPGTWTIELRVGGRKFVSQSFQVVKR
jgi:Domain of unknown function (DUF3859)